MRVLLLILTILTGACSRPTADPRPPTVDHPEPTADSRQPTPEQEDFVITLGPGGKPLTATERVHLISWNDVAYRENLCRKEIITPIYDALRRDLQTWWRFSPREPIPGLPGREWATRPVTIELVGRVDFLLVADIYRLCVGMANPADLSIADPDECIFKTIRVRRNGVDVILPVPVERCHDPGPVARSWSVNLMVMPAAVDPDPQRQPSKVHAAWETAADDGQVAFRFGRAGPRPVIAADAFGPEETRPSAAVIKAVAGPLREHYRTLAIGDRRVVLMVFAYLPWRQALVAWEALRDIDPQVEFVFAPNRTNRFHCWSAGNELWELFHIQGREAYHEVRKKDPELDDGLVIVNGELVEREPPPPHANCAETTWRDPREIAIPHVPPPEAP